MILRVVGLPLSVPLPLGVRGTDATVAAMRAVIDDAQHSPMVQSMARRLGTLDDLWLFLRTRVAFVPDPEGVEQLQLPEMMLADIAENGMAVGDCDDRTTLGASLAKAKGWGVSVVVMTPYEDDPEFRHVLFAVRETKSGLWVSMDAQEGFPPGEWPGAERIKAYPV